MRPPERDLDILEGMLAELGAYLGSAELFWPLDLEPDPSNPHVPRLTLGNLLLALDGLHAEEATLSDAARTRLARARSSWEAQRASHRAALERKAGREIEARLRLWEGFLTDLSQEPEAAAEYPVQVRNRLILTRLMAATDARARPAQARARLQALDQRLRQRFQPGAFVLAAPLERMYSPAEYWFLYGSPAIAPAAG